MQEISKKVCSHVQKVNTFAVYEDLEESSKEIIKVEGKTLKESPSKRFKDDLSAVRFNTHFFAYGILQNHYFPN